MEQPRTYLAILGAMKTEELFELSEQVEELMASPGWQRVSDLLNEFRERSVSAAVHRDAIYADHARITNQLGFVSGLEAVPEIMRKIREVAASVRDGLEAEAAAERAAKEYEEAPLWK